MTFNINNCTASHPCHCGYGKTTPHETGEDGCVRFVTVPPDPAPDDPRLGKMWLVTGSVITDFTLRQQRGYSEHPCGCWTTHGESNNSLPDET